MRPFITQVTQFADQAPLGMAKRLAERSLPSVPHQLQQSRDIPLLHRLIGRNALFSNKMIDKRT